MNYQIWKLRHRLLKQAKNVLAIIVGETGGGKSYTGLRLCYDLDPNFSIRRVVFTAKEFMELVSRPEGHPDYLEKGACVLFEEIGVGSGASSREWWSLHNRCILYVLTTFRWRNLGIFCTTPSLSTVDKGLRRLFHYYIETVEIIRSRNVCKTKFSKMQYNPKYDKIYIKLMRDKYGRKINFFEVKKPPVKMVNAYEKKKAKFSEQLNRDITEKLSPKKDKQKKMGFKDRLEIILANLDRYTLTNNKGERVMNRTRIKLDFNLSGSGGDRLAKGVLDTLAERGRTL